MALINDFLTSDWRGVMWDDREFDRLTGSRKRLELNGQGELGTYKSERTRKNITWKNF